MLCPSCKRAYMVIVTESVTYIIYKCLECGYTETVVRRRQR